MSKMKNKLGKIAELFLKNHPEFTELNAWDYVLHHYDLRMGDMIEQQMKHLPEPRLKIQTKTVEEAEELARLLGWRLHYCSDYLMSKIIIRQMGREVKVVVFDEERELDVINLLKGIA